MSIIELLRSLRIGPFSVLDFATAYLGVYLVAPLLSKLFRRLGFDIPRTSWLWFTLPIAILVHIAIGLKTPLTKMFLDPNGYYSIKILILAMIALGVRQIKRVNRQ